MTSVHPPTHQPAPQTKNKVTAPHPFVFCVLFATGRRVIRAMQHTRAVNLVFPLLRRRAKKWYPRGRSGGVWQPRRPSLDPPTMFPGVNRCPETTCFTLFYGPKTSEGSGGGLQSPRGRGPPRTSTCRKGRCLKRKGDRSDGGGTVGAATVEPARKCSRTSQAL